MKQTFLAHILAIGIVIITIKGVMSLTTPANAQPNPSLQPQQLIRQIGSIDVFKFEDATNTCYVAASVYGNYERPAISCVKR